MGWSDYGQPHNFATLQLREAATSLDARDFVFDLFPNPAEGKVWLSYQFDEKPSAVKLELFDLLGRIVFIDELTDPGTQGLEIIELGGYESGHYIVKLSSQSGIVSRKLVILD